MAPYDGQNANLATSKGIESDGRINIGISPVGGGAAQKPLLKEYSDIAAYFNSHFNFWGRKLNFVPISSAGSSNFGPNPAQEQQRADDVVAGESGPYGANFFATVSNSLSLSQTYYDVLAKNKVITVDNREPLVGEDHFRDPNGDGDTSDGYYEWSYMPGFDVIGRNLGDWICKQVPHGPADKALNGGAAESLLARKFGYVVHTFADEPTPDTGPLDTALAGCGISVPPKDRLKFQYAGGAGEDYAAVESGLVNLRADNVTSIICVCMTASLRLTVMPAATNQSYFPEWLVSSYGQNDFDQYISDTSGPPEQMAHAYGISFRSEWSAVPSLPVDQAVKGADPTHTWPQADGAGFQSAHYWQAERYPGLLMLAAGIQMAGPNLTPQTFAHGMQEYKGLQGTNFPNPPTPTADGTNQYHAAKVGFSNDHTMVDDAAVIWYSPNERSFWNNGEAGTWCFSAERHSISDPWPAANQPFDRSKPCHPDT